MPYRTVRWRPGHKTFLVDDDRICSVPTLEGPDGVLTDPIQIFRYLDCCFPEAHLLPCISDLIREQAIADLTWLASTLLPLLGVIAGAEMYGDGADAAMRLRQAAAGKIAAQFAAAETRLTRHPWLCGAQWHIPDALLSHCWGMRGEAEVAFHRYPRVVEHFGRCARRPSSRQAAVRELFA